MWRSVVRARGLLLILALLWLVAPVYAQEDPNCPGAPIPRLTVGSTARVLPGDPNNVRSDANRGAELVGAIPGGETFDVLAGPTCVDGLNWWQIQYGDLTGWTVEGLGSDYWVEPSDTGVEAVPTPTVEPTAVPVVEPASRFEPPAPISPINVLESGTRARVINDDPGSDSITLTIRQTPGRSGAPLAQAVEGDVLTIVDGPDEADGLVWWQVETARGTTGWVIEGLMNGEVYERTLLALCPESNDRLVYRVGDYIVTSGHDGGSPCVLDRINVPAWTTFSVSWFDNQFVLSPDGTDVVYVDNLPTGSSFSNALYRLQMDGSERLRLTNGINVNWASWSPDGQQIAVATGAQIGIIPADGSSYYTLTQPGNTRNWVDWLADSESVVYIEQDRLADQMGTAIDYAFLQVNTQEGGLHDVFDPPLEWQVSGYGVSPDRTMLAVSAVEYVLIDGMSGTEPVKFLDLMNVIGGATRIFDLETGEVVAEVDSSVDQLEWLPDRSAVISLGYGDGNGVLVAPVNGDAPYTVELSGDPLPESYRNFLGWESDTVFLVYVGFGFQIEPGDIGLWAVDVQSGQVVRRW
jgi:hypothetical protein